MGAETTVYVQVGRMVREWVEVSAVTLGEAQYKAEQLPGVSIVFDARYELPETETGDT